MTASKHRRIAIAADHGGAELKARIVEVLRDAVPGAEIVDLGTHGRGSVDYPLFAARLAAGVSKGDYDQGVLVCGTGTGMAIVANKFKGVRAAQCTDEFMARMAREHNDANVLTLGERVVGPGSAESITRAFFSTPFAGGRHARRVELIHKIEAGEDINGGNA